MQRLGLWAGAGLLCGLAYKLATDWWIWVRHRDDLASGVVVLAVAVTVGLFVVARRPPLARRFLVGGAQAGCAFGALWSHTETVDRLFWIVGFGLTGAISLVTGVLDHRRAAARARESVAG